MEKWIEVSRQRPEDGQSVRTRDSDGREFNCTYRLNGDRFHIAGYVWDHTNASEWHPIDSAYKGEPQKW